MAARIAMYRKNAQAESRAHGCGEEAALRMVKTESTDAAAIAP